MSHCKAESGRDEWTAELQQYLLGKYGAKYTIDIYGKCGMPLACGSNCSQFISKYKFFLALENSICRDYMSEKVWHPLQWHVVPIVLGAQLEDYSRLLPKSSFIHPAQFGSMQELGDYLVKLDKNDNLYNSYLKWEESHFVRDKVYDSDFFCNLCFKLHTDHKPKVYRNLSDWWSKKEQCSATIT